MRGLQAWNVLFKCYCFIHNAALSQTLCCSQTLTHHTHQQRPYLILSPIPLFLLHRNIWGTYFSLKNFNLNKNKFTGLLILTMGRIKYVRQIQRNPLQCGCLACVLSARLHFCSFVSEHNGVSLYMCLNWYTLPIFHNVKSLRVFFFFFRGIC